MKKYLLFALAFTLIIGSVNAQKKKDILKMPKAESPLDPNTKEVTYTIEFSNDMTDSVLYKRAMHWYNSAIKSMRVQPEESKAPSIISAKGEMDLLFPAEGDGAQAKAYRLKYFMETKVDGNKVTTRIYHFNVQNTIYTPIEPWIKEQDEDYLKKYYLIYIEDQAEQILSGFKEFVNVTVYMK